MRITLEEVMQRIYDAEENCAVSLSSDWDGGWRVRIGGSEHTTFLEEAYVASPHEAAEWLHERALIHYPEYAKRLGITISRDAGIPRHRSGGLS